MIDSKSGNLRLARVCSSTVLLSYIRRPTIYFTESVAYHTQSFTFLSMEISTWRSPNPKNRFKNIYVCLQHFNIEYIRQKRFTNKMYCITKLRKNTVFSNILSPTINPLTLFRSVQHQTCIWGQNIGPTQENRLRNFI